MEGTLVAQGITKDGLYQLLSQDDSFDHSKVQSSKPSSMLSFFSNKELVNSSQESDFLSTCTQLVSFLTSGKMSPNLLHNRFGLPKKQVLQTIIKHLPLHNISSQNFDFCDACQLILKPDHHLSCCILIYGVQLLSTLWMVTNITFHLLMISQGIAGYFFLFLNQKHLIHSNSSNSLWKNNFPYLLKPYNQTWGVNL